MSRRSIQVCATLIVAVIAGGIGGDVGAGPVLPDFSPANCVPGAPINNTFFPLVPGTTFHYSANLVDPEDPQSGETDLEVSEDFVTFKTKLIAGVVAREVRARSWLNGLLEEDTQDWYAQDTAGNVWYMGESTTAFERDEDGNVIDTNTEGSWQAGVNGALPGFIMPASPQVGFNYRQEFAPNDAALDQATILALDESASVPAGSFTNVLKTLETSELEPDVVENKFYAPGVGAVLIEEDFNDAGVPLNLTRLQSVTVIPLPPAFWPGLAVVIGLAGALQWRRRQWVGRCHALSR